MMKQLLIAPIIVLLATTCFSQGFNGVFYTGTLFSSFSGISVLNDTIYSRGSLKLNDKDNNQRIMITQISKDGKIIKHKIIADTNYLISAESRTLMIDKTGNILSVFNKKADYIIKLDKKLNIINQKPFLRDSSYENYSFEKIVEIDSSYLVIGQLNSYTNPPTNQISILRLDKDLKIKSEKVQKPESKNKFVSVLDVKVINDEVYILYGDDAQIPGDIQYSDRKYKLIKYNYKENIISPLFEYDYKSKGYEGIYGFERTKTGNWIFVGYKIRQVYIDKIVAVPILWVFDKDFKEIHRSQFANLEDYTHLDYLDRIIPTQDGFYAIGQVSNPANKVTGCMVIKLNENGVPVWQRHIKPPPVNGLQRYGRSFDGVLLSDGSLVVSGHSGYRAGWVFRMTPDGCVLQNDCGIATATTDQPETKLNVYPNPTQDVLHIESESGESIKQISVYNSIGEQVYLSDCQGLHALEINTSAFQNGMYVLQISYDESRTVQQKFVVLH
jgi:hypothetical protein